MSNLKELAKQGFFLEPDSADSIEKIEPDSFRELLGYLKKENILVVSREVIGKFTEGLKILKTLQTAEKYSLNDYVKSLNEKYSVLKEILAKKIDASNLVSINKCGVGKTSVIGMVKSREEQGDNLLVNLEDPTGEIQCVFQKSLGEKLGLDDVVAVGGNINNKIFFAEKVVFPDVPLRQPNYSSAQIRVVFTEKKCDADYIIKKNKIQNKTRGSSTEISQPAIISIGNVAILIAPNIEPSDALRKRYINMKNSDFIIDVVPDIVFTNKEGSTNYKGISIVPENTIIDLKTREITSLK